MKMSSRRQSYLCVALATALLGGCACNRGEPAAEPAQAAPVAAAVAPQQTTTVETFSVSTEELFDFDKATLRTEASADLDAAIAKYQGNASLVSMSVVGHTDSVGSDAYNQDLSERRAAAVRDYLVAKGIDGSKIQASGRGESSPIASNQTAEGRQKNRRVDITAELQRDGVR
jgi:OOP family OmpA-OmpF porin